MYQPYQEHVSIVRNKHIIVLRKELSNMCVMPTYSGKCVYSGCLHELYPSKAISIHKQDRFDQLAFQHINRALALRTVVSLGLCYVHYEPQIVHRVLRKVQNQNYSQKDCYSHIIHVREINEIGLAGNRTCLLGTLRLKRICLFTTGK